MAKPENHTYKTTVVIYSLTQDFDYVGHLYGRSFPGKLPKGTDLMQGDHVHRVEGGLKWGSHLIPEGTFEKFHETKTETISYTRRKQKVA